MAVNPRLLAAAAAREEQLARGGGRGIGVSPLVTAQARNAVTQDGAQRAAQQAGMSRTAQIMQAQRGGAAKQGGPSGIVGRVLGNSIVKGALKPLELFDIPRRGVIAAEEMMAESLPDFLKPLMPATMLIDENRSRANKGSFWDHLGDSNYGFGQIAKQIHTGNEGVDKWGNRIAGFAGDVALDPLTYVTVGANKVPGLTGRIGLVADATAKGIDDVDLLARIGQHGARAVEDPAHRALLGLQEQGLRFGGARVPGTGRIADTLEAVSSAARLKAGEGKLGQATRRWGAGRDPELRAAVEALATGNGQMDARRAGNLIRETYAGRAAERGVLNKFDRQAVRVGDKFGDDAAYTHLMESGVANPELEDWRALETSLLEHQRAPYISQAGLDTGITADIGGIENHLPHIERDEWAQFAERAAGGGPGSPSAARAATQQLERQIKPERLPDGTFRTYKILGKDFTPITGTIQERNEWAEALFGIKMLEDSPRVLTSRSVENAGRAMGNVARNAELTVGAKEIHGLGDRAASIDLAPHRSALASVANEGEVLRGQLDARGGRIQRDVEQAAGVSLKDAEAAKGTAADTLKGARGEVRDLTGQQRQIVTDTDRLARKAQTGLDKATRDLQVAEDRLRLAKVDYRTRGGKAFEAAVKRETTARDKALRAMETAQRELERRSALRSEMSGELQRAAREVPRAQQLEEALPGRLEDVGARQAEAQARLQEIAANTSPPVAAAEAAVPPPAALPEPVTAVPEAVPPAPRMAAPEAVVTPSAVDPRLYDQAHIDNVRSIIKKATEANQAQTWAVNEMKRAIDKAGATGKIGRKSVEQVTEELAAGEAKLVQIRNVINEGRAFLAESARAPKLEAATTKAAPKAAAKAVAPVVEQAATPPVAAVEAAVPEAPLAGPPVPQLHQQLEGVNARAAGARSQAEAEAKRAADAVQSGAQRRQGLGKRLAGFDERAARGEAGAAATEPHFLESVTERMKPFREQEATALGAAEERVGEAANRQSHFQAQLDALPEGMRGDLDAIEPLLNTAKKTEAVATADLKAAAADVGKAGKELSAAGRLPKAPNATGKFDAYEAVHAELTAAANNPNLTPLTKDQLNRYGAGVAKLATIDADERRMGQFLKDLTSGKMESQIETIARDGFELLKTNDLLGSDKWITTEMAAARKNWTATIKAEPGGFGKAIDAYTKFFKNWATATPGFQVRNSLSATVMNMSDGVSFRNMRDGVRIWAAHRKLPEGDWISTLPAHLQPHAQKVVDAVLTSGAGGRYSAAELGERAYEGGTRGWLSKLSKNKVTELSQNVGERVEGSVRAGMALDSILGGEGVNSATQRINRIHFNYSDVNEFDQAIRRVVPFWTFMSRNLPLQVQQMWLKPRTYLQYESLKRNFDIDPDKKLYMPGWMRDEGAFNVTPGMAISPDIGSNQLMEQLSMLGSPRMLSNVNPLFKAPLELATNRDFFYGSSYKDNDFQKVGIEQRVLAPLFNALGVGADTPSGPVAERKVTNAISDLVPLIGSINRLGSTTPNREGKGAQSIANFWGAPIRMIDPDAEAKDVINKRYASQRLDPNEARRKALAQFGG